MFVRIIVLLGVFFGFSMGIASAMTEKEAGEMLTQFIAKKEQSLRRFEDLQRAYREERRRVHLHYGTARFDQYEERVIRTGKALVVFSEEFFSLRLCVKRLGQVNANHPIISLTNEFMRRGIRVAEQQLKDVAWLNRQRRRGQISLVKQLLREVELLQVQLRSLKRS